MLEVLKRQQINDRLPSGLPSDATVAHKTGNLPGIAHDAGIVYTPTGPRIVVVLTAGFTAYDDVIALNERVAALAYGLPLDAFAARYALDSAPAVTVGPGQAAEIRLRVTNVSDFVWSPTARVATVWRDVSRRRPDWQDAGRYLGGPVDRGATVSVTLSAAAPYDPGVYILDLELIDPPAGRSGNHVQVQVVVRR